MTEYFPEVLTQQSLGHPDDRPAPEDERKLTLEASSWLKSQMLKAAREVRSAEGGTAWPLYCGSGTARPGLGLITFICYIVTYSSIRVL